MSASKRARSLLLAVETAASKPRACRTLRRPTVETILANREFSGILGNPLIATARGSGHPHYPPAPTLGWRPRFVGQKIRRDERHDYQPLDEFVEAVMRCPLPDTEEFATYCEPFFHLQQER